MKYKSKTSSVAMNWRFSNELLLKKLMNSLILNKQRKPKTALPMIPKAK
jgi:hypothetical protein